MALSLGIKVGLQIKIGNDYMLVTEIESAVRVKVVVTAKGVDREIWLTDQEAVEVLPDVRVYCGASEGKGGETYTRLAFEAPRSIQIERMKPVYTGSPYHPTPTPKFSPTRTGPVRS